MLLTVTQLLVALSSIKIFKLELAQDSKVIRAIALVGVLVVNYSIMHKSLNTLETFILVSRAVWIVMANYTILSVLVNTGAFRVSMLLSLVRVTVQLAIVYISIHYLWRDAVEFERVNTLALIFSTPALVILRRLFNIRFNLSRQYIPVHVVNIAALILILCSLMLDVLVFGNHLHIENVVMVVSAVFGYLFVGVLLVAINMDRVYRNTIKNQRGC